MKTVWITLISIAAIALQGVMLLATGFTGTLLFVSLLNVL